MSKSFKKNRDDYDDEVDATSAFKKRQEERTKKLIEKTAEIEKLAAFPLRNAD